jgi:hypothetical protein
VVDRHPQALTVSGLVDPTVVRIRRKKTNSSSAMKTTPKTGYQLKSHSWTDSTYARDAFAVLLAMR